MKYFDNCISIAEAKALYRKLAFKYHPDSSKDDGNAIIFAEITEEYKNFINSFKEGNRSETVSNNNFDEILEVCIDTLFGRFEKKIQEKRGLLGMLMNLNADKIKGTAKVYLTEMIKNTNWYYKCKTNEDAYFSNGEAFKDFTKIVENFVRV